MLSHETRLGGDRRAGRTLFAVGVRPRQAGRPRFHGLQQVEAAFRRRPAALALDRSRSPRSSRRPARRSTSSSRCSKARPTAAGTARCRSSFDGADARLRAGRRRRLLRRCRLSGRPWLGPDRAAGAGGRRRLCAAGAGQFHAAALSRRRRADRRAAAPRVRKGDRVVVKTTAGEVMAKVLRRRTARKIELLSLNPAHPDAQHRDGGRRMAGPHRLGEPVGAMRAAMPAGSCRLLGAAVAIVRRRSARARRARGRTLRLQAAPMRRLPEPAADRSTRRAAARRRRAGLATAPTRQPAPMQRAAVAPAIVAPPDARPGERTAARAAARRSVSWLRLLPPPKPEMPNEWDGNPSSGRSRSLGGLRGDGLRHRDRRHREPSGRRDLRLRGRDTWPCGVRARTAFRLWLRGRALACDVPPEPSGRRSIVAPAASASRMSAPGWSRTAGRGPRRRPLRRGREKAAPERRAYSAAPPRLVGPGTRLPDCTASTVRAAGASSGRPLS